MLLDNFRTCTANSLNLIFLQEEAKKQAEIIANNLQESSNNLKATKDAYEKLQTELQLAELLDVPSEQLQESYKKLESMKETICNVGSKPGVFSDELRIFCWS